MASLFPDDRPSARPKAPFRKFPARPKAVDREPDPLPEGWVLAHCDGGSRGNPGPAGFGAVLVDSAGIPLAELSEFLGFRTNNVAEYSGLLAVLAWALENGHRQMRVISDSELMVKQVQGKYKVNSPDLKPLHEEARRRIAQFAQFEIHHALRHKNKVADRLANEAMDRGMGKASGNSAASQTATPYPQRAEAPMTPRVMDPAGRGGETSRGQGTQGAETSASPEASRGPEVMRRREPAGSLEAARQQEATRPMLRGFVRDGVIHLLGSTKLPENSFVKIVPE